MYVFSKESFCEDCKKTLFLFSEPDFHDVDGDILICSGKYTGSFRKSLLSFKFFNNKDAGRFHAKLLAENIKKTADLSSVDGILFVPAYRLKNGRKYNQSEILAKNVGKILSLPVYKYLRKKKDIKSQTSCKNSKERIKNVEGAYGVYKKHEKDVFGKTFIIIDDIVTTGSTLYECGTAVKNAGGKVIYAASAKTVFGSSSSTFVLRVQNGDGKEVFPKRKIRIPVDFEKALKRKILKESLYTRFLR